MALLVAIEGIDGSGKGTQAARLCEALTARSFRTRLFSFPQYEQTRFGKRIGDFLNGRFGALGDVHPVLVSLLFAGDRFESRRSLLDALEQNDVVICDRYIASNIAHQGAKALPEERVDLRAWIEFVEYEQHQMPPADVTIWLDVPVPVAQTRILQKQQRSYTEQAADLQEADGQYLESVREVYRELAQGNHWQTVSVLANGAARSVHEIGEEIFSIVSSHLI